MIKRSPGEVHCTKSHGGVVFCIKIESRRGGGEGEKKKGGGEDMEADKPRIEWRSGTGARV